MFSQIFKKKKPGIRNLLPDATDEDLRLIKEIEPYTMTLVERQWAMLTAIRYVDRAGIEGDIVECGVWRGGNMMLAKKASTRPRKFWLYDTFAGMSEPTEADVDAGGGRAVDRMNKYQTPTHSEWCYASIEDVRENFERAALLDETVRLVKGKVEDTLRVPANLPGKIALLRLDTDWYESTRAELEILYPRLAAGGVCIIDDYGHWQGARKAVDEYFAQTPVLLHRIDYTARMFVKQC
jgi:O-methyltransferase